MEKLNCKIVSLLLYLMVLGSISADEGDVVLVGNQVFAGNPHKCVTPDNQLLEISSTNEEDVEDCALFMLIEHSTANAFTMTDLTLAPPTNQLTLVGQIIQYTDTGSSITFEDPNNHFLTVTGISSSNTDALTDENNPLQLKFSDLVSYPGYYFFVPGDCYVAHCLICDESDVFKCANCTDGTTHNADRSFCIACSTISECESCVSDDNLDYVADNCTQCEKGYFVDENATCSIIDCGEPGEIDSGSVSVESTLINTTAVYSCHEGYELIGGANVTCQDTGQWQATPSCLFVDCSFPRAPDNGTVTYTETTYGATITYSCITGFVIEGQSSAMCGGNGDWSGSLPICRVIDCGNITNPEHGEVTFTSTGYLANALFTCNEDYILIGDELATCSSSEQWEQIPFCLEATTTTTESVDEVTSTTKKPNQDDVPTAEAQVSDHRSTIAIAGGIVVGVVVVVVVAVVIVIIYKVKKSKTRTGSAPDDGAQQHQPVGSSALTYRGQAIAPLKPQVRQDAWYNNGDEKLPPEKLREAFGAPQQPRPFGGAAGGGGTSSVGDEGAYGVEMDQYNLPNSPPPAYQSQNFTRPKSSLVKKK